MLNNFLWPILQDYDIDDMWFQQDGATCHTAHATMALLHEKFPGRIISRNSEVSWPPRSCDLTPLDFFLWGHLKSKVYVNMPTTIQQLKDEISGRIDEIDEQLCRDEILICGSTCAAGAVADIIFHP